MSDARHSEVVLSAVVRIPASARLPARRPYLLISRDGGRIAVTGTTDSYQLSSGSFSNLADALNVCLPVARRNGGTTVYIRDDVLASNGP